MSCSTFKRAIRLICGANNNNENNTDENKPGGGSVASPSFARSTPVVVFLPNTRRVRRQCWPFVTRRRFRQTRFIISGRPRFCPYIRAQNAVECTFAFAYGVDRNKRICGLSFATKKIRLRITKASYIDRCVEIEGRKWNWILFALKKSFNASALMGLFS